MPTITLSKKDAKTLRRILSLSDREIGELMQQGDSEAGIPPAPVESGKPTKVDSKTKGKKKA